MYIQRRKEPAVTAGFPDVILAQLTTVGKFLIMMLNILGITSIMMPPGLDGTTVWYIHSTMIPYASGECRAMTHPWPHGIVLVTGLGRLTFSD
jgi:hypothetical protein